MMIQLDKTIKKKATNTISTFVYDLPERNILLRLSRSLLIGKYTFFYLTSRQPTNTKQ